jgi:hypothetical protein
VSSADKPSKAAILMRRYATDFNNARNALCQASQDPSLGVKAEEVSIMSPCFMASVDVDAGAVKDTDLTFGMTSWADGENDSANHISAYQVMDELVEYYMNKTRFPHLEVR